MKKEQTPERNITPPPEPEKEEDTRPLKYYCQDKVGTLHWGHTPEEAQMGAAAANREIGNFD